MHLYGSKGDVKCSAERLTVWSKHKSPTVIGSSHSSLVTSDKSHQVGDVTHREIVMASSSNEDTLQIQSHSFPVFDFAQD
jgi:hypothetical protein